MLARVHSPKLLNETLLGSLSETERYAGAWAKKLKPGTVLALVGDLGAGKTTFTKFLAKALGFAGTVSSPTFTLANRYLGTYPIYHLDCFRLETAEACVGAGLQDVLPSRDGITVLEWANKFPQLLPNATWVLEFSYVDEHTRKVQGWQVKL